MKTLHSAQVRIEKLTSLWCRPAHSTGLTSVTFRFGTSTCLCGGRLREAGKETAADNEFSASAKVTLHPNNWQGLLSLCFSPARLPLYVFPVPSSTYFQRFILYLCALLSDSSGGVWFFWPLPPTSLLCLQYCPLKLLSSFPFPFTTTAEVWTTHGVTGIKSNFQGYICPVGKVDITPSGLCGLKGWIEHSIVGERGPREHALPSKLLYRAAWRCALKAW